MSRTQHARHVRHDHLDERGLVRGTVARPRRRHLAAWLRRIGNATAAQGGIGDTATAIALVFDNTTNLLTATAHGHELGEEVLIIPDSGATFPSELTGSERAAGVITFGGGQPTPGDTITLGGTVYTFRAAGQLDHSTANEIAIGGTLTATLQNAADAIEGIKTGNVKASAGTLTLLTVPAAATTLTIGARVYTFKAHTDVDPADFSATTASIGLDENGETTTTAAAKIAAAIGADDPLLDATSAAAVVTLTGREVGPAGNAVLAQSASHFDTPVDPTSGANTLTEATEPNVTAEHAANDATTIDVAAREVGADGDAIALAASVATVSASTLAGGAGVPYFAIPLAANTLNLAASPEDAAAGTVVAFTDDGTGTFTIERPVDADEILDLIRAGVRPEQLEAATDIDAI